MHRPPPLRTDGSNAFARYSMEQRVPRIARDVLVQNPSYPATVLRAIERLADDIENNEPVPPPSYPGPDVPAWSVAHAEHAGETWLDTEWFFAELAFYRELCHASRFWETGRDPFAPMKEEELSGQRIWSRLEGAMAARGTREERIGSLVEASLWGNRVDLSYTVAASRTHSNPDDLLIDDRTAAAPLLAQKGANIHVIADNAGTELALDLAIVGAVLEDAEARVTVHLKIQPMFVSDAMPRDVWLLLARLRALSGELGSLSAHLANCFENGRLVLAPDPFWNGPRFLWDAPPHLRAALGSATIVLLKGDANYRRLIGDAPWPPTTPLAQASAYTASPILCVRTMKSDPIVGLPAGRAEALDTAHPRWRIDGQRGVMQMQMLLPSTTNA